jgi:hypothetical protein
MQASAVDALGWLAAGLTAATFLCTEMRRLRLLALSANLAFIAYGTLANLTPVLTLHLLLAPVNLWQLVRISRRAVASSKCSMAAADPRGVGRDSSEPQIPKVGSAHSSAS